MKLKTIDVNGQTYAVVQDGKPVYEQDGKDVPFDAVHTVGTITRLNGEAKGHREAREAAEGRLKAFEGIQDPAKAIEAIQTVSNLNAGQLKTAEQVDEIRREAKRAAEQQVADAARASGEKIQHLTKELDGLTQTYHGEKIGGAFGRSKFVQEKVAAPMDLLMSHFGRHFKVEDGKVIGVNAAGGTIHSVARPGEVADFDEALSILVDGYAHKDMILKGTNHSGSGARSPQGQPGGGKTMTQAAFQALSPMAQAQLMTGANPPVLVD